ncbi:ankyrin repeat domain-containing protein [Noviherbaspirillum saxi]|uniref:Ankyrin repeat domain-containing protein n=1 Tax=Noviherbaspirillum saxi TaxID=2320863 RepID=A0A3A3FKW6_9BURK|nr:ankyrin repeat domain-containing protein [Noviherbaspirillum saxi]RJF95834.1 ankyrin repeat domain-containing protein [Noviherbaspirillum saxi]
MSIPKLNTSRRKCLGALVAFPLMALSGRHASAGAYDDFFRAVKIDHVAVVKSLLARGLDPNLIEAERGETGLMLALREKSMGVFELLLNAPAIDLEVQAFNGNTALMFASYQGNLQAVKALIAKGAEVNKPGWTPLHYAASIGNNDIVQLLLEKSAYIDADSPNKTTPIMMAARGGHIMTVKLLLDEGADASLKNDAGMTAIDFAEKNEFKDIAEGLTYRLKKAGKL